MANSPSDLVEAIIAREQNDNQDHAVVKDLLEVAKLRQSKRIPRRPERGRGIAQHHRMDVGPSDTTSSWKVANVRLILASLHRSPKEYMRDGLCFAPFARLPRSPLSVESKILLIRLFHFDTLICLRPLGSDQVADLDEAVSKRKKAVAAAASSLVPISGAIATTELWTPREAKSSILSGLQEDTDGPDPSLWTLSNGLESVGMKEMLEFGSAAAAAQEEEGRGWPRRVRLHTKLGKRCRKDIATGRSEILIKPTFDPLLGDSSAAKVSHGDKASNPTMRSDL